MGSLVVIALVLVASILLALQSERVSTSLAGLVAGAISSEQLHVAVEGVKGSWVRGLALTGVRASFSPEGGDGGWAVSADTVRLSYRLRHLFRKTVWVEAAEVAGGRARVWLAEEAAPAEPQPPREPGASWLPGGWEVRLGDLDLQATKVEVWEGEGWMEEGTEPHASQRQDPSGSQPQELPAWRAGLEVPGEPWTATDVRIRARDLELGAVLAVVLDVLEGSFRPPGLPQEAPEEWGRVAASGRVESGSVFLDSLVIESPESQARVRGTVPMAMQGLAPDGVAVQFSAEPLHMRDLGPLLPPSVSDSIRLYAQGEARSVEGVLLVELEADSRGSGRLEVNGQVVGEGDDASFLVEVGLEGVDLLAWGVVADPMTLDALVEADLEGVPTAIRGSMQLEATLRHGGQDLDVRARMLARADSGGGPWRADWSLASAGVDAEGTGTLALGDPLVSSLEGRVSYDRHAGAPPIPGWDIPVIRGLVRWEGRGSSLDSLLARAELRIDTAEVNRTFVEGLVVVAETRLGQATVSLEGGVAGGQISARGRMDLGQLSGELLEARLEGVDVAALLGDSVPSAVSADASGRLDSLSPLRASGSLRVHSAEYGEMRLDSALVTADQRGGATELRLEAAFPDSGQVSLAGRFDSSEEPARLQVDSLRFAHLDLPAILGGVDATGLPSTDLSGTGSADLAAAQGVWEGVVSVELASSRVGVQPVEAGLFTAELTGSAAGVDLDIRLPDGAITVEARVEGLGSLPEVIVPEARFLAVDVGALLGREDLDFLLSGRFEGRLQGNRLEEMVGSGVLELEESRLAAVPVEAASLEILVAGGRTEVVLVGRVAGGGVRAEAKSDLTGSVPEELNAEAWIEADSMSWEWLRLDEGRLRLTVTDGVLHLDTLSLQSPDGVFVASGTLPLSASRGQNGEITFGGELVGADVLAALAGADLAAIGSGVLEGTVTGSLDNLEMVVVATVDALLLDDFRVEGIELGGEALYTEADGFAGGTVTLGADEVHLSGFVLRRLDVEAVREPGEDMVVTASAIMDDLRDATFSAKLELAPAPLAVLVEGLEFRVDQDRWTLARPTRIDLSDGIEIDSLALVSEDREILARGRVGTHGPLSLRVDIEAFPLETVADMAGFPSLRGAMSGVLSLDGTAEAPLLDASFSGRLEPSGMAASDVTVTAAFASGTMEFESVVVMEDRQGLRVDATLPLDLSLTSGFGGLTDGEPVLLDAAADSLSLEWVSLFIPTDVAQSLRGVANGTVRIEGNPESPRLTGSLDLHQASFRLPGLGAEYRRGEARIRFQEDQILLDSLRIRSGGGSLIGSGTLTLPRLDEPEYAASLTVDGFHAMRAFGLDATVSGELDLSGAGSQLAVAGRLEMESGEFQLGDMVAAPGVRPVTLSEEDYRELARVFGYRQPAEPGAPSDFFELLSLDVDVRLRRDSWVRQRASPEMAVQFTGDVSVRKDPEGPILLVGMVESVPGRSYVEQFGRRFSISSGTLEFRGTPDATHVNLRGEYAVPSRDDPGASTVVVALDITGTPEDLRLELSSTPPLEPSDMVSYIVTGRPAGQSLGADEGGSLTGAGEAFALGRLTGAVEAYAREEVGLDVVQITTDGLKGMILVAGRYVSPSLYLGIRQPLSLQRSSGDASERTPEPELEVELEALRWLLLNLRADGRAGVEFFVRTRISYD